ncbi:MAG: YceH family protein [Rhodocyclaceae bacterium]
MTTADTPESPTGAAGDLLDAVEARVLGVLVEKAFVTPDTYPLSVNALVAGCNQLTGREPVMNLTEAQVNAALDRLISLKLAARRDQAGARVAKYEHLLRLRYSLPPPEQAVLATLMLRGPQTPGEIRQRCERMHAFADIGAVDAVLEHLAEKYPALSAALPRAPGTKETRHAHLLCGEAVLEQIIAEHTAVGGTTGRGRNAELEDEVRRLRAELDALRAEFDDFRAQFQ